MRAEAPSDAVLKTRELVLWQEIARQFRANYVRHSTGSKSWVTGGASAGLCGRCLGDVAHLGGAPGGAEIAGIDRCGTSSLHHNLGQHPEIAFLKPFGEDFEQNRCVRRMPCS